MIKHILFEDINGEVSMTFTVFVLGAFFSLLLFVGGSVIALLKFTFADIVMGPLTIVHMSGVDCAAVILSLGTTCTTVTAALGGLYWGRKHTKSKVQ